MTKPLASTSLWKTICPESGHLIQRFSGLSRLKRVLMRGRTTSEIQFIGSSLKRVTGAAGSGRLGNRADAGSQFRNQRGDRRNRLVRGLAVRIQREANPLDEGGADDDPVGALRDGCSIGRRLHAKADSDRQIGVA